MTAHEPIDVSTVHQPYRFSQRDYVLLSEHGAFDQLAKAELIEGVIVAVNAQYSRHARVQTALLRALADACDRLGSDLGAWVEASVAIDDHNMPQPDIVVSRGLPDEGPITLDRVALIIEVADTSLDFDLEAKAALYATAGVPEYWVADVNAKVIHQMWSPQGAAYAQQRGCSFGEPTSAATIAALSIKTRDLG
jgi:Uma2 family endonuclease